MAMTTADIVRKVRRIEIKSRKLSDHLFSGEYHSAFKGRGMSFSEVREYSYGDDVRNIDWNVTARAGTPYIKTFEEERELTVMLLIDVSHSLNFGSSETFKKDLLIEIAAVIAFSANDNKDKIGAILFSDKIEMYIPPQKGRKNVLKFIREMLVIDPQSKETNLNLALDYFNKVQKKKCITFILSDFKSPDFSRPLNISGKKHDVIGIKIGDKTEKSVPNIGFINVTDPESGLMKIMDTNSLEFRRLYEKQFEMHEAQTKDLFKKSGAEFVSLMTEDDFVKPLINLFKKR
ncbi:MAG TPA: DUF58 domain-containing protein [Saprospiraceae bacterium]|nr:DUF58 domain-containing protein [Saprospiraceae bacterium]HPN69088.1 DUF58 domain-containing protein [Saprospiraceae bacterium]